MREQRLHYRSRICGCHRRPAQLRYRTRRIERCALFRRPAERRSGKALPGLRFPGPGRQDLFHARSRSAEGRQRSRRHRHEAGRRSRAQAEAIQERPFVEPQCALIALDPHTGEIKALVGGRNYGASQLNRVLAERPPGSIFKPFVYAAAMNTAVAGGTVRSRPPRSWWMSRPPSSSTARNTRPDNFEHEFYGPVTLRKALAKSLNVATIKVAEMVGYQTRGESRASSGHQRRREGDAGDGDRLL